MQKKDAARRSGLYIWLSSPTGNRSSAGHYGRSVLIVIILTGLVCSISYIAPWLRFSRKQKIKTPFSTKISTLLTETPPRLAVDCQTTRKNDSNYKSEYFLELSSCSTSTTSTTDPDAAKIILAWTSLYEHDIWFGLQNERDYARVLNGSGCTFTSNKSLVSEADMLVFHGCFQQRNGFRYPANRTAQQLYVYITTEAPTSNYCRNAFVPADGMFNITATFKLDSDVVLSYSPMLRTRAEAENSSINRAANKTALAFWYMSDCSSGWSSKRLRYVQELRKYMKVDVYGSCYAYFPDSEGGCRKNDPGMDECFLSQSKKYKFYLSFENALCKDYITEKLFKILQPRSDVVPVVLGPSVAEYEKLVPSGSFIHVKNFTNPEALAKYLKYLDSNDEAYNAYHAWRTKFYYDPLPGRSSLDQHPPSQLQKLCRLAHEPPEPKVWDRLLAWYSVEDNCHTIDDVCVDYGICPAQVTTG